VIDVALLGVIRRRHLREGVSIREIARRAQLSRNTIRMGPSAIQVGQRMLVASCGGASRGSRGWMFNVNRYKMAA
jgi:hypothetical protein